MVEKSKNNMLKLSKKTKNSIYSRQQAPKVFEIVANIYCLKAKYLKKAKNLLECIYCSSKDINKSIMSPGVLSSNNKNNQIQDDLKKFKKDLVSLRNFVEKNFEYVGKDFSKKSSIS